MPPFVVVPVALDSFRLPQRLIAELLALASLVALALAPPRPSAPALLRSPALRAVAPLLLVAVASLATTAHGAHVRDALADLAIGAVVLVGWSLVLEPTALRRLLDAALVPAAVLALLGILQLHHLYYPLAFAESLSGERLAVTSLSGNPGDLAALLVLPCLIAQAGLPGARGWRLGWRLLALALCAYALAGTQTLTSLLAALGGSVVLWAALLPRRRLIVGAIATLVAAVLLVALVRPLRERVESLRQMVADGTGLNEALTGRLDAWRVAVRLLEDHPLAGVGLGAYRAEFGAAKIRLLAAGVPFYAGHINPSFSNAHDEYLEVGADLGWPGVAAIIWGLAMVLHAAWRARRRLTQAERGLAWGGLVGLALLALGYFPFRLGPVAFVAIAWLAWLFANADESEEDGSGAGTERHLALAAILAVALLAQGLRAWYRLESSALVRAVQHEMATLGGARAPGLTLRISEAALVRAQDRDPAAIEPLAFHADLLLVAGRLADAGRAYERAARHELRPEVLLHWGLALWKEGRTDEALVQLRRGMALGPRMGTKLPPEAASLVDRTPLLPIPPLIPPAPARGSRPPAS
ncbi:MAG TPA: O-antigen ligase family protein [Thermoanaerobaculia bacterium]|nr:O-antigen ligase family protein [Thermoanaerobaculia bacterium]